MLRNKTIETVNKDGKLLALFCGILIDGMVLIGLIVYSALTLVS
jgi:hypothetical protein